MTNQEYTTTPTEMDAAVKGDNKQRDRTLEALSKESSWLNHLVLLCWVLGLMFNIKSLVSVMRMDSPDIISFRLAIDGVIAWSGFLMLYWAMFYIKPRKISRSIVLIVGIVLMSLGIIRISTTSTMVDAELAKVKAASAVRVASDSERNNLP